MNFGFLKRKRPVPAPKPLISPIQNAVLAELASGTEITGYELRQRLAAAGVRCNGPEFYENMTRLEDRGYVSGRNEVKTIGKGEVTERWYRMTL